VAIPLIYNVRSARVRWVSAIVATAGIAGAVGVFVAMLSLARGFRATLVSSGSPGNAIVMRSGSSSEMYSAIDLDEARIIGDAPGVMRAGGQPLVSPEVVVVAPFNLRSSGTEANVQVRGVSPRVLDVRKNVRMREGRFFRPGVTELVVGSGAAHAYEGLTLGSSVQFGGGTWTVVGVFDAGGSAFDSEVWCDARVLNQTYKRPENIFQSVTVHLSAQEDLGTFKDALTADPRLNVTVEREVAYYARQSAGLTTMIRVLGFLIAFVMGFGAVFAALNTMYSAVAARGREIATMRALGFGAGSVVVSFLFESVFIAAAGGIVGCLAVLPLNGVATGTLNWQTFSHVAFAFRVSPALLAQGMIFALLMGLIGGLPPAIRAARRPVAISLREL
jgi:putative ABC transport system permease protein